MALCLNNNNNNNNTAVAVVRLAPTRDYETFGFFYISGVFEIFNNLIRCLEGLFKIAKGEKV